MAIGLNSSVSSAPSAPRPERVAAFLVGLAAAWSLALLILALVLPIVTPQSPPAYATATAPVGAGAGALHASTTLLPTAQVTLVADSGYLVLLLVAIPLLATLLVGLLLRSAAAGRSGPWAGRAAWALGSALLLAGVVGFLTILIGIAVVPVGGLLLAACGQIVPLGAAVRRRHG
ncbi:hypothetical protein [Streptacidiphilus albus]|uniref:hypothetical protein n=1 Tax=Streptacidiphilus albus TaxID=105425 RepID=UPI00054BCBD6|nr:hypothetical protein [Streptacidiphilus albus]